MKKKKLKKNRIIVVSVTAVFLSYIFLGDSGLFSTNSINIDSDFNNLILDDDGNNLRSSAVTNSEEWITNGGFNSTSDPWYNTTEGDLSDINASYSSEQAKYEIIGDTYTFSDISGIPQSSDWTVYNNPSFPVLPDEYNIIDNEGCRVEHFWDENADQTRNTPSVQYKRNCTVGVNMSDYTITSASISAVFNASVEATGDEEIESYFESITYIATGDYVRFYVMISDLNGNQEYIIADNQTQKLGQDGGALPTIASYGDTFMDNIDEDVLIALLTSVLSYDNYNFTITLGIDIYCEDNIFGADEDRFNHLIIREVNLNFTCEKKIDRYSTITWSQEGNQINGTNYRVDDANLKFKYKIDNNVTNLTPNSEIRVLINDNKHIETRKLSEVNTTLKEAKEGGFDVTSLIQTDVNITLSIQVIILDNFGLNQTFTISIDDVSLNITYISIAPEEVTECFIYLNTEESLQKEVTIGDTVNISSRYEDNDNDFILDAIVQVDIGGDIILINETVSLELYNITINSTILNLGTNYIYFTASKPGYITREFTLIIVVNPKDTEIELYLNGYDKTTEKAIDVTYGENIYINITYKDIEGLPTHISNATVELLGMGNPQNLTENPTLKSYNITISSTLLNIGIKYLTINAQRDNYTTQSIVFKVEVTARETYIDNVFIDVTETFMAEILWNEVVNITATYNDTLTNASISGASVQLEKTGYSANFTEDNPRNLYWITINSSDFTIGVNYLTITAQQDNFSIATQVIILTVNERETELDIILNHIGSSSIDVRWKEEFNITINYNDIESGFLSNATVSLKEGAVLIDYFTEYPTQYTLIVNTSSLDIGANTLTILAIKDNFSAAIGNIFVNVLERESEIISYLNGTLGSTIEFTYGELLNITALYKDSNLLTYIDGANLSLRDGNTILYNFSSHPNPGLYNITINVGDLGVGFNILTIYANKDNYSIALKTISITVTERDTYFEIFLEGKDKTTEKSISVSSGQTINITIYYRDLGTGGYIDLANVTLLGENMSLLFDEGMNYYNYTLNTSSLEVGVSFLSISAYKENYTQISEVLTIIVREKAATYKLFLDGIDKTTERAISKSVNETLEIKVLYNDSISFDFISGATLNLTGGGIPDMNFYDNGTFYWISINTTDLDQGINFLNILAQASKYEAQSILITVNIVETETNMTLYLDGVDITTTPSKKIQVNQNMTFAVDYIISDTSLFMENATVLLFGEGLNYIFNENADNYSLSINSDVLNRGVNFLTIYAYKNNYEPHSIILTIEVIEKPTDLEVFLNRINKTDELGIDVTIQTQLNVTIKYFENGTSSNLENATISITGAGILDTLSFSQPFNHYWIMVNTSEIYYGMRLLTITAEKNNYQTYTVVLRINVIKITTQINTTSGVPNVEVVEGTNPSLKIILKDSFFNTTVTDAAVSYNWLYGQGLLTDTNSDGIYEIDLTTAPPGTYTVRIFADAGDDYYFTPYEMTVTVTAPPAPDLSFLWLLLLLSLIAIIIIAAYATAYQYRFKIPRQIRLLRKYKKSLKNPINPKVEVFKRNTTIKSIYDARIDSLSKNLKEKEIKLEEESVLSKDMDFAAPTK